MGLSRYVSRCWARASWFCILNWFLKLNWELSNLTLFRVKNNLEIIQRLGLMFQRHCVIVIWPWTSDLTSREKRIRTQDATVFPFHTCSILVSSWKPNILEKAVVWVLLIMTSSLTSSACLTVQFSSDTNSPELGKPVEQGLSPRGLPPREMPGGKGAQTAHASAWPTPNLEFLCFPFKVFCCCFFFFC